MATAFVSSRRFTQQEFSEWVEHESRYLPGHYELIDGRIVVTPPTKLQHGTLKVELARLLGNHVRRGLLGTILDCGYDLPSGDTLEPDISFVAAGRLARHPADDDIQGFCRVVPDLAVEILSRSTAHLDRNKKKSIYERNGVREYWLVDRRRRSVTILQLGPIGFGVPEIVTHGRIRSLVLPDLELTVEEIFSVLA